MYQDKKIEIKEPPIRIYIIRIALMIWIVFGAFKYEINPFFFGSTILVALILIAWLPLKTIYIVQNTLYIKNVRIIKISSTKIEIPIYQIEEIRFEKGKWSFTRFILDGFGYLAGSFGKEPSYIFYKAKNQNWEKMETIGSPEENEALVRLINEFKKK